MGGKSDEVEMESSGNSTAQLMSSTIRDEDVKRGSAKRARKSRELLSGDIDVPTIHSYASKSPHSSTLELVQPPHSLATGIAPINMFPPENKLLPSFSVPTSSTSVPPSRRDSRYFGNSLLPLPFDMEPRTIEEMIGQHDSSHDGKWKQGTEII